MEIDFYGFNVVLHFDTLRRFHLLPHAIKEEQNSNSKKISKIVLKNCVAWKKVEKNIIKNSKTAAMLLRRKMINIY